MEVFVARQPIFNKDKEVVAYELLYRDSHQNFFNNNINSSKATSILLVNSYFSLGIENLTENKKAFINFDKNLINIDIPMIFDKNTIVVELLEDIVPDKIFISKLKKLKSEGYTIALDDFVYNYPSQELIELSDILKIDFMKNTIKEIKAIEKKWKDEKKIFLAEKVETNDMFDLALDIGCDYFQGYFFSKPIIVSGKGLKANNISYMKIINELNLKTPSYDNISKIIEQDVHMTYKLLKLISSKFSLSNNIRSVKHALTILGLEEIQRWVYLVMIQEMSHNTPCEIFKLSLFRSKLSELLAINSIHKNRRLELMLMGLLSTIDVILEQPLEKILKLLPLSNDIKDAMLNKKSIFNDIYNLILNYEKGSWEEVLTYSSNLNIDINILPNFYFESIKWSNELFEYIKKIQSKYDEL